MNKNCTAAACPVCGLYIASRKELPFSTKRSWRINVTDKLGYDQEFILSLSEKACIYQHHFEKGDVRAGKPIGIFCILF